MKIKGESIRKNIKLAGRESKYFDSLALRFTQSTTTYRRSKAKLRFIGKLKRKLQLEIEDRKR